MTKPRSNNKLQTLYIETGIQRVAEVLFKFPDKEFSLSDLAKEAGVAKSNIGKMLKDLEKNEMVDKVELAKIWRIKAKQSSWRFRTAKIVYNLNVIYQSGLVEYLTEYFKNPQSIIVFGSFRNGEDVSNSDIDIAIETSDKKFHETFKILELKEFEKLLRRQIQIHGFDRKSVDRNVFNNIANGIVLSGFLEVKP